jgi:hypothetical protein
MGWTDRAADATIWDGSARSRTRSHVELLRPHMQHAAHPVEGPEGSVQEEELVFLAVPGSRTKLHSSRTRAVNATLGGTGIEASPSWPRNSCYKVHVTAVQFASRCRQRPRRRPSATAPSVGALADSGRTTSSGRFGSRDIRRTPPSTSGATRRCAICVARPAGASRIGSPSRRNPVAGMASTSTTLIRVFKRECRFAVSMVPTLGHTSTERRHRSTRPR